MHKLFLILFLLVGFVPYFESIDIIGPQWLYLSIINILIFVSYFKDSNYVSLVSFLFKQKIVKVYLIFYLFVLFSLVFSENITVSLVDFARITTSLFVFYNFSFLFFYKKLSLKLISIFISFVLFIEIIYSYIPLFTFLLDNNFSSIDFASLPNALKGVTGNKNIFASNVAFKLPFVIFLLDSSKRKINLILSLLLFTISIITLFLLSARASLISLFIILLLYFVYTLSTRSVKHIVLGFSTISIFFLINISVSVFSSENYSLATKASTISINDTSTSYRLTLYANAFDYIKQNPFIGCGIGNWKIQSLPYWKDRLTGYTIPYHAHNDFLELTTEIGLFGGLSYFLIFFFITFWCFKHLFSGNYNAFLLLSLTAVYFIDAFLNFPLERAISQINFCLLISLSTLFNNNESKAN